MVPLIDGHLDLAWNALSFNRDLTLPLGEIRRRERSMTDHPARGRGTVSLPELQKAGVAVCLGTLLARGGPAQKPREGYSRTDLDYANPSIAYAAAAGQLAYYRLLEKQGWIRLIRRRGELEAHWDGWNSSGGGDQPLGVIVSMEGTDPIVDLEIADQWWEEGLRVAGLAHYGPGVHAGGTGSDSPLSPAGRRLLEKFSQLGVIVDVTHLCERSFDQVMDEFEGPVLASHHNCRVLTPGERQLSDRQIRALIARKAVIGAALDAWMLHPGWERGVTSPQVVGLEAAADHIEHVCQLAGDALHSAVGSDLDGGFGNEQTPRDLRSAADLQRLAEVLARRGFGHADIAAVFHGNWLRFFLRHLPE